MKSYLKFLSRNKLYTAIEVFGLAVALMFILIIAKFTDEKLGIDKYHVNADYTYALATEDFIGSAYGLSSYLSNRYPEIERVCAVCDANLQRAIVSGQYFDAKSLAVDTTFLDVFSYKLVEGERDNALKNRDMAIISKEFANKVFPNQRSVVGKSISIDWGDTTSVLTVGGVFENIRNSCIKDYDLIFNMQLVGEHVNSGVKNTELGNAAGVTLFLQTNPNSNFVSKSEDLLNYFKEFYWIYQMEVRKKVNLVPLSEIYYSPIPQAQSEFNQGDRQFVLILAAVALFILLFALINYVNLTVAQTGFRAKEMAMRRLLGSSKFKVIMRFIGEAILLTAISFAISLFFAEAVKPFTTRLLGSEISVIQHITSKEIVFGISLILLIGAVAGIIPALLISRYKPIDVVKGSFRLNSKMVLGKVFVVVQNIVTICMLAITLALFLQLRHMMNKPLGYKTENIMDVTVPAVYGSSRSENSGMTPYYLLRDELEKLPSVKRVGFAHGNPMMLWENNTFAYNDGTLSLMTLFLDTTTFKILDIEIVQKNEEPLVNSFWLTESATRKLNVDYDEKEVRFSPDEVIRVCGIIKDLHRGTATFDNSENCNVVRVYNGRPTNLFIETTDNHKAAIEDIKNCMERITETEFEGRYMDEILRNQYKDERNILNIVLIFTIITIIISMLGLVAMSTYYTRQRALEVGVRKVFGSTSWEMFTRLVGNFLKLLLISFVIAVPLAWYVIDYWLKDYSYRINISPLIFVAAGFVTLLIAAAAISWQSAKAANANPVDTVKRQQM